MVFYRFGAVILNAFGGPGNEHRSAPLRRDGTILVALRSTGLGVLFSGEITGRQHQKGHPRGVGFAADRPVAAQRKLKAITSGSVAVS